MSDMRRSVKHTEKRTCRICQKERTLGCFPGRNRDKCVSCYKSHGAWRWKKLGIVGFDKDKYDVLVAKQANRCAVCNREDSAQALSVDHCHRTGIVRGLLCNNCNRGIGMLGDSAEFLSAAAKYLAPYMEYNRPDWFMAP